MSFDIEKFSYRLTVLLDENNMTQTQLAKKIGTSNVTICRYLTCERLPRLDVVTKIADVFNISLDYLLGLSDDKTVQNLTEKAQEVASGFECGIKIDGFNDILEGDIIECLVKERIDL